MLCGFFLYLAIVGSILPGQVVPGVILPDGTRLHYRCNGQFVFTNSHAFLLLINIRLLSMYVYLYIFVINIFLNYLFGKLSSEMVASFYLFTLVCDST